MEFRSRNMIMPAHLNGAGTLFGGQALAWIDEESAVFASCQLQSRMLVTKYMGEIDFKAPGRLGDIVEIGTELVSLGRTSITLRCVMRNKTTQENILVIDKIVFVNIDENGIPVPHGVTQERKN